MTRIAQKAPYSTVGFHLMKTSSCRSSVAPPKITMIASDSQWTGDTMSFQLNQEIWPIEATPARAVAGMKPCHLNARKNTNSGKQVASNCMDVEESPPPLQKALSAFRGPD